MVGWLDSWIVEFSRAASRAALHSFLHPTTGLLYASCPARPDGQPTLAARVRSSDSVVRSHGQNETLSGLHAAKAQGTTREFKYTSSIVYPSALTALATLGSFNCKP